MIRHRRTKIVATLGPASSSPEVIRKLFDAGADVFRLNFSHGKHEDHKATHAIIREIEARSGRAIAILTDMQGPKLRIGSFVNDAVMLTVGDKFRLDLDESLGDQRRAPLPHPEILAAIKEGTDLLIDDGRVRLRLEKVGADFIEGIVTVGGKLTNRKGVNVPGAVLPISPLTKKDRRDLDYALELGVDWIGLSFVQRPEDIDEARARIGTRAGIIAKIEKPAAIDRLSDIIERADGIMVARGDLGVELPLEEVPGLQKRIVRAARSAGKPVIIATQMLESMVRSPTPTRAEISDVATAVYDGADAVMLSAESAAGEYPVEAVETMDRIARQVERDPFYESLMRANDTNPEATTADAITAAARQVAETLNAAAVVTFSTSGTTALRAARERPGVPYIICLTPRRETARRLALVWGIHSVEVEDARNFADMVKRACDVAKHEGIAKDGDRLVITAGVPFGTPGMTNVLRVAWIGEESHPA
ncbi:MAG: pyruvate kinase [Alphaproteobacteria bacterium]|nr:pyruvate kinase [Alphaproteobacteria bacterium]